MEKSNIWKFASITIGVVLVITIALILNGNQAITSCNKDLVKCDELSKKLDLTNSALTDKMGIIQNDLNFCKMSLANKELENLFIKNTTSNVVTQIVTNKPISPLYCSMGNCTTHNDCIHLTEHTIDRTSRCDIVLGADYGCCRVNVIG